MWAVDLREIKKEFPETLRVWSETLILQLFSGMLPKLEVGRQNPYH